MSSPSPPDACVAPQPARRASSGLDYLLAVGTGLLFVAYIPVFIAAPGLAQGHINDLDVMWFIPLASMLCCLAFATSWLLFGSGAWSRITWSLALMLAVAGCPAAYFAIMTMSPGGPPQHYAQPPPDPPPVKWEPIGQ